MEYIRNDMEGADGESRRRAACDLVQGLCVLFKQSVTQLCGGYINTLLQKYQTNPVEYVEHRSLLCACWLYSLCAEFSVPDNTLKHTCLDHVEGGIDLNLSFVFFMLM